MSNFHHNNTMAGVHWPEKPIEDLLIRVKLRRKDSILPHKFEADSPNNIQNDRTQEYTFKWLEKTFCKWEISKYNERYNCVTENELHYHEMLQNEEDSNIPQKVYTSFSNYNYSSIKKDTVLDKISAFVNNMDISNVSDSVSTGKLFKSEDNLFENNGVVTMYVMMDCSEYNDDNVPIYKQDQILVTLVYHPGKHCLTVTPDVNNLDWSPYEVKDKNCHYEYSVELDFGYVESNKDLVFLLNRLHRKWRKRNKKLMSMSAPSAGRKFSYVSIEILFANDFDMDKAYVEYDLKPPDGTECEGLLHGTTHTVQPQKLEDKNQWNFSHLIELDVTSEIDKSPTNLRIVLEIISLDRWNCHRTEGYAHYNIELSPVNDIVNLECVRPEEKDFVEAESRRFFIGGCNLIRDLDRICAPENQDPQYRYVGTGSISIRYKVINQSRLETSIFDSGATTSSQLLDGAEQVLNKYRKAKAKLAAVTKDIDVND